MNPKQSRRHFLRGAGVALALPWMESLPLLGAAASKGPAAVGADKPPVRFATVYFSNGVEPVHWWAKGSGASMEVGPGLEPMLPFREDFSFLRGLYNQKAVDSSSAHLGRMANMLSGATVSLDPAEIRVEKTMDQVLSQRIGGQTAVPSLVLGIEPNELRLEDGVSMIYGSCISWASATKPATKEIYPARAFDRLVGDGTARELDRSILDSVLEQTHDLQPRVSRADSKKLDEYLESIRDIEKRIERFMIFARNGGGFRGRRGPIGVHAAGLALNFGPGSLGGDVCGNFLVCLRLYRTRRLGCFIRCAKVSAFGLAAQQAGSPAGRLQSPGRVALALAFGNRWFFAFPGLPGAVESGTFRPLFRSIRPGKMHLVRFRLVTLLVSKFPSNRLL